MSEIVDGIVELIKSYINFENIVMIPFLMLVGTKLKKSVKISDNLIPDVLVCLGIAGACVISLSANIPANAFQWIVLIMVAIGQGYFTGLAAVGVHQQLKQRGALKQLSSFDGIDSSDYDETMKERR